MLLNNGKSKGILRGERDCLKFAHGYRLYLRFVSRNKKVAQKYSDALVFAFSHGPILAFYHNYRCNKDIFAYLRHLNEVNLVLLPLRYNSTCPWVRKQPNF